MKRRSQKRCDLCGAQVLDAYMCADCGRVLRELLVGDPGVKAAVNARWHPRTQPGIVWYIKQLYKTAYRQSRVGESVGRNGGSGCFRREARVCDGEENNPCDWCDTTGSSGSGLLVDVRATDLLRRIRVTLADWEARCYTCKDHAHDDRVLMLIENAGDYPEALCIRQARFLAAHVRLLRRHDKDVLVLHNAMLSFAREAFSVINAPQQVCCGGCPNTSGADVKCGVILYAPENARTVVCPKCRATHDVEALREQMRTAAADYVLPAAELRKLMETRLGDRIPKSSFYQLVRDGRLRPHSVDADGSPLYTYQDVCEARAKPIPDRKSAAGD